MRTRGATVLSRVVADCGATSLTGSNRLALVLLQQGYDIIGAIEVPRAAGHGLHALNIGGLEW